MPTALFKDTGQLVPCAIVFKNSLPNNARLYLFTAIVIIICKLLLKRALQYSERLYVAHFFSLLRKFINFFMFIMPIVAWCKIMCCGIVTKNEKWKNWEASISLALVIVSLININNWPYIGIDNFQLINQIRTLA